jgi:TonB family protein
MSMSKTVKAILFFSLLAVSGIVAHAATLRSIPSLPTPQQPLRVALIGFVQNGAMNFSTTPKSRFETRFAAALSGDARVRLLDDGMLATALAGVGYQGSINLSVEEARRLGAAIGCDFFIIGKTDSFRRSEQANESHEETFIGVIVADGRTGKLAHFDFILKKADGREASQKDAAQELESRANHYVEKMLAFRSMREAATAASPEIAEDLPDTDSALAAGFKPPEFTHRVKPAYPEAAERADINATVDVRVVFRANGEIGEIDILRWAGFGLEESAVRAIRQLRFKPATRNGQPINVGALVQYNFRRVSESDANQKPPEAAPKVEEKPQFDLRDLLKPRTRKPQ